MIKQVSFLLIAFILLSFTSHKDLNKKIDKEIKDAFGIETYVYNKITFPTEVNKELPSKFESSNFLNIKANNEIVGYAYMGKALSKTDTFDFLVLFDKDLIVIKTKVLVYREDYGGEIGSKRWLKQFIGKTQHDDLRYGDNIVAISGATISVRSMTNSMNNLLKSLKILHSKNVL
jgi:Na+-translocating ferredoxin:NAD+ oxidoreductase RnfG subunit